MISSLHFKLQILDIVPILARLYFLEKLPVTLSYAQASVLLCMGLQAKDISAIEVCFLAGLLFVIIYRLLYT